MEGAGPCGELGWASLPLKGPGGATEEQRRTLAITFHEAQELLI